MHPTPVRSLAAIAVLVLAACAEERAPINRVQPQALKKTFFVGPDLTQAGDDPEFWMRGTVVDVGFGAAQDGLFTSTYAQPVSRIRWEITENFLNARLAYERIQDTDGKGEKHDGLRRKETNDGQIVASYRIQSHFDIQNQYNPSTGEQMNVVEENSWDRKWFERTYMRIDWSQNLVTDAYDFDTLAMLGLYGGVKYAPLAYTVLDQNDPDAPHFDAEGGYLDVTTKALAVPQMIDLSSLGWGIDKFPACFLDADFAGGTAPYGNCNNVELTIRQSFRKLPNNDYEPFDMDGVRFQAAGIFTTEYKGYDRDYGMVDEKWYRFAARYNIWKRSHYYTDPVKMTGAIACATRETTQVPTGLVSADPNRDEDRNGTADECEAAGAGSRCDVFNHKCTLPYWEREAIVTPWYMTSGATDEIAGLSRQLAKAETDAEKAALNRGIADARVRGEDLFVSTNWAVEEWDLAMKSAIQVARLVECRAAGGEGTDCDSIYPMWKGQQDDIDEAITIARTMNACFRQKRNWTDAGCLQAAKDAAGKLAEDRGDAADASTRAIGEVVAMQPAIVLCHNPVVKGDHPACGAEGLTVRLGDLRYHTVLAIDKPQQPSAWGIMVDADDPVTGEKIAASINVWTHVTDVATQGLVDLVRYMNGEIPTSSITEGKYVHEWIRAQQLGASGAAAILSEDEINERLAAAHAGAEAEQVADAKKGQIPAPIREILKRGRAIAQDVAATTDVPSQEQARVSARLRAARGSAAEAELLNPAMLQLSGIKGSLPVDGAIRDRASPLAMNNPKVRSEMRRMRENALAARGACILHEAPEASSLTGIADAMRRKFPVVEGESELDRQGRYERMLRFLRRKYHYAVIAHEMGHSIGLRHNFVSSYAGLFFRPQYWQLRTKNGTVNTQCGTGTGNAFKPGPVALADAGKCVGPRYYDPVTSEEQDQLIWMFSQSTVMDYPGDVSGDLIGLGVYDFAATRLFYGDNVSVYDVKNGETPDPAYRQNGSIGRGMLAATDNFGGLAGISYGLGGGDGVEDFHYSQLQKNYKLIRDCRPIVATPPETWNAEADGEWDPVVDGLIVSVDGQQTKCRQLPVDYVGYTQLARPGGEGARNNPSIDPQGRVRVPYAFATDSWADTGNVSVFRHDAGADPYEQVMFLITSQENRHIFDNFRRHRTTFSARGASDRSYGRYNEKLLGISGGIGFFGTIYQDLAINQGFSFTTLWPFVAGNFEANIIASSIAFDHFTRQISRPQPGPHYYRDPRFGDPVLRSASDADDYGAGTNFGVVVNGEPIVTIPNGSTGYLRDIGFGGHPLENGLSDEHGEFDSSYMINAGSYYDKINAAILLSESEDRFISQSRKDFHDARYRAVGMADLYPDGYRRVIANALTNDRSLLAPRLEATPLANAAGPTPLLDARADDSADPDARAYPQRPIGWVSWWPTNGPSVCFPREGRNVCTGTGTQNFDPVAVPPERQAYIDPQIGWEVQKFLIAWTMAYIPANQKTMWTDMMRVWRVGIDNMPEFASRIEWQDPQSGELYVARTYGKECLFGTAPANTKAACTAAKGKWVEKGIAARVLEYANDITAKGYALETAGNPPSGDRPAGFNAFGRAIVKRHPDGTPIIVPDAMVRDWNAAGTGLVAVKACDQNVDPNCTKVSLDRNRFAREVVGYKSVPDYLREMGNRFGLFGTESPRGTYP